jgi:threonine synthase
MMTNHFHDGHMQYISTRGQAQPTTFIQAAIEGLARDGGLLIPARFPDLAGKIDLLSAFTYRALAVEIFQRFIESDIDEASIKTLVDRSYRSFSTAEVTPLRFTDEAIILELFHGPTLAFKDIALQFLGNLFERLLLQQQVPLNLLGATSGDTGSAAIHGVKGKNGITIFMLHPKGKISPIQERQMTTVLDRNVVNIALEGTFDDAQRIIKEVFGDLAFKDRYRLGSVNSINWVRVMAQIVYYFYATFRFQERFPDRPVVFSVPTGNFGDIYAGYVAWKMGLPIARLILATNENDILYRALTSGRYQIREVCATISPSMDIQISSNFERFLYDLVDGDSMLIRSMMTDLADTGSFSLSSFQLEKAAKIFTAVRVDTDQTLQTIRRYAQKGIVLDPHTAVGVAAAADSGFDSVICLATAHPAKFNEAVVRATGQTADLPPALQGIMAMESRCLVASNDTAEIKAIIEKHLNPDQPPYRQ